MGMDTELSRAAAHFGVTDGSGVRPLAVDLQVPLLATLALGTFRSTARASRSLALIIAPEMQNTEAAMLFNILYLITCYSDLLDQCRHD